MIKSESGEEDLGLEKRKDAYSFEQRENRKDRYRHRDFSQ